jgi:head-tail adaptor
MTRIQKLCNRVTLLKRRLVEEEDGSFKELWEEEGTLWAQVNPYMGREALGEGWNSFNPVPLKYKVTLRFRHGQFTRISWEGATLALLCPPLIDVRRRWLVCLTYALGENNE